MRTTLDIDRSVISAAKREAGRRGVTMSALVEEALRKELRNRPVVLSLGELPTFDSGGALIDIADHVALDEAMEP